jgi:hypothetical protein
VRLVAFGGKGDDGLIHGKPSDAGDGGVGTDTCTDGLGWDQFILRAGEADGDVITDFEGVGAAQGDVVRLLGFAAGASLSETAPGAYAIQQGGATVGTFFAASGLVSGQDVFFV